MKSTKWVAAVPPYLAVWAGLFLFHSAWGAMLGFHAAILLVLIIARPHIPISILFKAKRFKRILPVAVLCASSGFAIYYLFPFFSTADELRSQLDAIGLSGSTWPWFIAYFSLVNPFLEEYFWRAYLGSDTKSFYLGDLVYAGFHGLVLMGKTHPLMVLFALGCLTFVGWLWRQIYREQEGLLVPVLGHMVADFSVMTAIYLIVR
jgi:hypothetical protein